MADKPKCVCGRPAKFRGDKVGDHEMGPLYYPKCSGYICDQHEHVWGTDGMHTNEFCKICFVNKPPTSASQ